MIGFNRRFSSLIKKSKELLSTTRSPSSFIMTINAGSIDKNHWIQDPLVGGGRIIGEVCHFVDLLRFLAQSKIIYFDKMNLDDSKKDTVTIQLKFENGSIGTIHYFTNGNTKYQKERLDIYNSGKIISIENFIRLKTYGWHKNMSKKLIFQDKGQSECINSFISCLKNKSPSPISFEEILEVSKVCIELAK